MIVEKRKRLLSPPEPEKQKEVRQTPPEKPAAQEREEHAVLPEPTPGEEDEYRQVSFGELYRYDGETSPFEREIHEMADRIATSGFRSDDEDGWLLVSRCFSGIYDPNADGFHEENDIIYDYFLNPAGRFILRKTVRKEYCKAGMPPIKSSETTVKECSVSEVMREMDFDGYYSYRMNNGWYETGSNIRYIEREGARGGGTLELKRKSGSKGQALYEKISSLADLAAHARKSGKQRELLEPEVETGSEIPPERKQPEMPAAAEKSGGEETVPESIREEERQRRKIGRLRLTAILLMIPVFCALVAVMGKNDIVWMPILVCVLSFALLGVALNTQSNGGGGGGIVAITDVLLLFPLIIIGGMENWGLIIGFLMVFNIVYVIIWGQVFRRANASLADLHARNEKVREEIRRKREREKNRRRPMSFSAVSEYTAEMDGAYERLAEEKRDVCSGFPWSAVFMPNMMRAILLCEEGNTVDHSNPDVSLAAIGRFKLSIEAYARYGVAPTGELIGYIESNHMNPELDEAMTWYRKLHS